MCLLTPPGSFGLLPVGGPSEDAPMLLHDVLLPDVVFANLPSGRDTVMGHHIVVDSGRWRRELAERQMPAPPGVQGDGMVQISRNHLFAISDMEPTPEHALNLLFASLAWEVGREVRDAVPTDLGPEQTDLLQMARGGDGLGSEVVQDGAE
jgi:hypothetical protein